MGLGIAPMLEDVRHGKETVDTIIDLVEQWGNPTFQSSPEFLYMAIKQARESKTDIVECGSGISTLAMAVCTEKMVYCLEHSPIWAEHIRKNAEKYGIKNIEVIYAPIKDGWYDVKSIPKSDLVVCDGPPRAYSDRNILKDFIKHDCKVLFDDVEELDGWGSNLVTFGASRLSGVFEVKQSKEVV